MCAAVFLAAVADGATLGATANAGLGEFPTAVSIFLGTVAASIVMYFTHERWNRLLSGHRRDRNLLFVRMPGSLPAGRIKVGNGAGRCRFTEDDGYIYDAPPEWIRKGEKLNVFINGHVVTVEVVLDEQGRPLPIEIWDEGR
jgi:hypothetical protein